MIAGHGPVGEAARVECVLTAVPAAVDEGRQRRLRGIEFGRIGEIVGLQSAVASGDEGEVAVERHVVDDAARIHQWHRGEAAARRANSEGEGDVGGQRTGALTIDLRLAESETGSVAGAGGVGETLRQNDLVALAEVQRAAEIERDGSCESTAPLRVYRFRRR